MTRLLAVLGAVCVAAFIYFIPAGAFLVAGLALLLLAAVRRDNQKHGKAVRR